MDYQYFVKHKNLSNSVMYEKRGKRKNYIESIYIRILYTDSILL